MWKTSAWLWKLLLPVLISFLIYSYYNQNVVNSLPTEDLKNSTIPEKKTNIIPEEPKPTSFGDQHVIVGQVERIDWVPHQPFVKDVLKLRYPVILTNTMASRWKALHLWNQPGYLETHPALATMKETQEGPENTFTFLDQKTSMYRAKIPGIQLTPNYTMSTMSSKEFFGKINNASHNQYLYWYGKVDGTLREDVQPADWLWVSADDREDFGLYLWLSGSDVRPAIHYDMDHNFFVQIGGTKKFVVFPPWEWKNLYPFPRTHPRWHKSQASYDHPNLTLVPNFGKAKGYEVILHPGDVFYNPPYWWHHVHSVTKSVSCASWSQSGTHQAMKYLWERKLFFDDIENEDEKLAAIKAFIMLIIHNTHGEDQVQSFISDMLTSRWVPLGPIFDRYHNHELCSFSQNFQLENWREKASKDLAYALERFSHVQGNGFSIQRHDVQAIRDLEMMDFFEFLIDEAVGPKRVFQFLNECMS